jgi:hypothetical protein
MAHYGALRRKRELLTRNNRVFSLDEAIPAIVAYRLAAGYERDSNRALVAQETRCHLHALKANTRVQRQQVAVTQKIRKRVFGMCHGAWHNADQAANTKFYARHAVSVIARYVFRRGYILGHN